MRWATHSSKHGDKPKAEKVFQVMLSEYGDRAIWHVVFAGAYREAKFPDDAIREFRHAIALDPKVGHAYFFLGLTLLEQNHWAQTDESLAAFREAVQQDPKDYFSNFYLGAGEAELKLFDESNQHLKVAAEAQPDSPEIWLYLGMNAFQQQNYKEAKANLLRRPLNSPAKTKHATTTKSAEPTWPLVAWNSLPAISEQAEKYVQHAQGHAEQGTGQ